MNGKSQFIFVDGMMRMVLMMCACYLPMAGKRMGNGASFSVCVFSGVGGRGSGSVEPTSQCVVTNPFPFNSTWPRDSIRNVPNLSRICLVASETWILSAEQNNKNRVKFFDGLDLIYSFGFSYVLKLIPCAMLYSLCPQTSNNVASSGQPHRHIQVLFNETP